MTKRKHKKLTYVMPLEFNKFSVLNYIKKEPHFCDSFLI